MKIRRALGLDRLSDAIAPYWNISGRVPISSRDQDGVTIFSDGQREVATLLGSKGRAFRHGVGTRLDRLAKSYGLDRYIPIVPGDLVVNCGANIGALTLGLVDRGARVIAVEPDPTTLTVLRWNVGALPGVEIVPTGLWKSDGDLTFYQAPQSADTSAINQDGPPITIPALKLDTLLAQRGVNKLRLLIGDAEGAEPEVIEGATETLANTDYFSMECGYERRGKRTLDTCKALLEARNFRVIHVTHRNRLIARKVSLGS